MTFLSHLDTTSVFYAAIAVAAFWFAIQLCWSAAGRRWLSLVSRLTGALLLAGVGVVMIFYSAFGQ